MEILCWSASTVAENLALDDELTLSAAETGRHMLRLWWGGPPTVVMGRNEKPEQVLDEDACRRFGVGVLKRSTGGGCVLQTDGVLNYSLVTPPPSSIDIRAGFRRGADLVCAILAAFGVEGRPEGISDVVVGDRKISGNAQARRRNGMLVHGTLLVDFPFDLAEAVLKHPPKEPDYRCGRCHRDFLATLRSLGVVANRETIERTALEAARRLFGSAHTEDRNDERCVCGN